MLVSVEQRMEATKWIIDWVEFNQTLNPLLQRIKTKVLKVIKDTNKRKSFSTVYKLIKRGNIVFCDQLDYQ